MGTLGSTLTRAAGLALGLSQLSGITLAKSFVENTEDSLELFSVSPTAASWNSGMLDSWD